MFHESDLLRYVDEVTALVATRMVEETSANYELCGSYSDGSPSCCVEVSIPLRRLKL